VIVGDNIILYITEKSLTNCYYTTNTVLELLVILLDGANGQTYNITNLHTVVAICEIAKPVANEICDSKIKNIVEIPVNVPKHNQVPKAGFYSKCQQANHLRLEAKVRTSENIPSNDPRLTDQRIILINTSLIFMGKANQQTNPNIKHNQFLSFHEKPVVLFTLNYFGVYPEIDNIMTVCLAN
jgi:uncharacterized membrane protein (UPF0127 family)